MDVSQTTGRAPRQPDLSRRTAEISDAAARVVNESRNLLYDVAASINLRDRVERHPIAVVLAAAGLGYVLGGGLFTRFTARAVRVGVRLAVLPFVRTELAGMARSSLMGQTATPVHQ